MHSEKFDVVMSYYRHKLWTIKQVRNAVVKEWITPEEFYEITGQTYE